MIGLTAMAFALHKANDASREALAASQQAHRGLCTLQSGYVKQLRQTRRALAAPPGTDDYRLVQLIGRKVLINSEQSLVARVKSLEDVKCS